LRIGVAALRRAAIGVLGAAVAALSGCATVPPEPIPHFQPYQLAPQGPPEPAASPLPVPPPPATAQTVPSTQINAALVRFALDQRATRAGYPKGAALPGASQGAWSEMIAAVDKFLRLPNDRVLALDLVRARVAIEAELDMDRSWFVQLPSGLAPSVRARAMALDQKLTAVRRLSQHAPPAPSPLVWPISPVIVTSLYGVRTDPFDGADKPHLGIDLKARSGQLVQAAGPGVVVRAEKAGGHGLHVEVLHDDGLTTGYSHLSMLLVAPGIRVPTGGALGLAGSTGRSTGPHLHFEVWRNGHPVDPLSELMDPALQQISSANLGGGE
jgi:murein DD-endopeptidase MepM/ murein hydrolase activator NlpD